MIGGKKTEIDVEEREMMRKKKMSISPDARSSRLGWGTRLFYWLRLLEHLARWDARACSPRPAKL